MAGHLQTLGPSLVEAGYLIVPIHAGRKNPIGNEWISNPLTKDTIPKYNGAGIGLLAGTGKYPLCIIDIDCVWEPGAQMAEKLAIAMLGFGLQRIGKYPKQALIYLAAEEGWPKGFSSKFKHPSCLKKQSRKGVSEPWEEKNNYLQIELLGKGSHENGGSSRKCASGCFSNHGKGDGSIGRIPESNQFGVFSQVSRIPFCPRASSE